MQLRNTGFGPSGETRVERGTLGKVVAMAQELQQKHDDSLSAQEVQAIGAEVGLDPAFVQQALQQIQAEKRQAAEHEAAEQAARAAATTPVVTPPQHQVWTAQYRRHGRRRRHVDPLVPAWWAAGWVLPFLFGFGLPSLIGLHPMEGGALPLFFLGWAGYIGVGTFLSAAERAKLDQMEAAAPVAHPVAPPQARVSRAALLETLFTLQRELEGAKQHRAFLSVDVVHSSEMKLGEPELAVEYTFGQFQSWVEETARSLGGEVQSAAGDGLMCVFHEDAAAVRAAGLLQQGIAAFNAARNRLATPFRIRCGVASGEVPAVPQGALGRVHSPVIDRAAVLQKQATPGAVVVSRELAGDALVVLGGLTPLPHPIGGEAAFVWTSGA